MITAETGKDPAQHYSEREQRFGRPVYRRIDAPASPEQERALSGLSPEAVEAAELAGEKIVGKFTCAPRNDAPLGGLKVVAENGWFAARPSGTENVQDLGGELHR